MRFLENGSTYTIVSTDDEGPDLIIIAPPTLPDTQILCEEYTFDGVLREDVVEFAAAILRGSARLSITGGLWRFTRLSVTTAGGTHVAGRRYRNDLEPWEARLVDAADVGGVP
ncbi:hypothetical protein ABT297_29895 [Dactylosporangium sp. NPDC000555]|uniref:hypothetical protein n=1 Tax=Dactylosporangium sp. NPDC000555 TaxID=3154260 RepID=UPI00332A88A2